MRHLASLLAGLITLPAVWLLLAIGQPMTTATIDAWETRNRFDTVQLIGPMAWLATAGIALGILACLRLSPIGPAIAGLTLAVLYGALFVNPLRVIDTIPERIDLGIVHAHPRGPVVNGTLAVIAACLLIALFNSDRWRRSAEPASAAPPPERPPVDPPAEEPLVWPDETPSGGGLGLLLAQSEPPEDLPTRTPSVPPPAWPARPAEESATPLPTETSAESDRPVEPDNLFEPRESAGAPTTDAATALLATQPVGPSAPAERSPAPASPWAGPPNKPDA